MNYILEKIRKMGACSAFSIASTQILKTNYVNIILIVLNLQHRELHYTFKCYEKVKKLTIFRGRVLQKLCLVR